MKPILQEDKNSIRRNEILDSAQKLIYTKGYEQMTIQDLLDDLQISKGAFYYYFSSKQSLLEAMVDRMMIELEHVLDPILEDPQLLTFEKFGRFFSTIVSWKTSQAPLMMALFNAQNLDENALFNQKIRAQLLIQFTPLMNRLIQQGIREGVFTCEYSDELGELFLVLLQGMSDNLGRQILDAAQAPLRMETMQVSVDVYTRAIEQVLGAAPKAFHFFDLTDLKAWDFAFEGQP